jgi:hypothetical protein
MIPGMIADLGGFGVVAQTIDGHGRMDHGSGEELPGLGKCLKAGMLSLESQSVAVSHPAQRDPSA